MLQVRPMSSRDWPSVETIYAEGIATRQATFETAAPAWEEFHASKLARPRLVIEVEGVLLGWAVLSPVSRRSCYRGVAELSIYVGEAARGLGLGTRLLRDMIDASADAGIWTMQATIFPENIASCRLVEKFGFRKVGFRERIAQLDGVWRDTVIYEKRLTEST